MTEECISAAKHTLPDLLNQYYKDDTAMRISVYKQDNYALIRELEQGYINPLDFVKCKEGFQHILDTLPKFQPFSMLDTNAERNRIAELFTEENAGRIMDYLRRRGKAADMDEGAVALGVMPKEYDKELFVHVEELLSDIKSTLNFYDSLSNDMENAFSKLTAFVKRIDEASRFDEAHFLPIAMDIFGQVPFSVKREYVSARKTRSSKETVTARRLHFESYYSFIVTDFFEGLHYGHYTRRCGICKKCFLMQSAARQKYCTGYAPVLFKGKQITCGKYAARTNRKELSEGNPVVRIYNNRCSAVRVEKSRGKLTEEDTQKALAFAKKHVQRAKQDNEYANKQYENGYVPRQAVCRRRDYFEITVIHKNGGERRDR